MSRIKTVFLSHALNDLYSVSEMQRILERERSRSDRTGQEFSLVIFPPVGQRPDSSDVFCLARALFRRSRSTDEIGWFAANQLSAILPSTAADGAWKFANDVCKMIPETSSPPDVTVYTYPSDRFRKSSENKQLRFPDIILGLTAEPLNRPSSYTRSDPQVSTPTVIERDVEEAGAPFKSVKSMETLFIKSLPRWKRAIDIAGSLVGLVLASPIMMATAIAIRLTSKGPLFFTQERTGQGYRRFKMYKFRTMVDGAEKQRAQVSHLNAMTGPLIKIDRDPRMTKIGSFLRKTSIDELPQLFNVLKGDMTIIGPRALSPLPSQYEPWQLRRFMVKPGVVCTWQAERRADTEFEEWMRSDLRYVDGASLWVDARLFAKTLLRVIACMGAR